MNEIHGMPGMNHRRDILRGCLRCGGLLALGGVASALGWRGLHGKCLRTGPCGGCPLFSDCGLTKAKNATTGDSQTGDSPKGDSQKGDSPKGDSQKGGSPKGGALSPRAHAHAPPMNRPSISLQALLGFFMIPSFDLRPHRGRTTLPGTANRPDQSNHV
jgi:hypothetical protein